jgi:PAS domain S-box-containing protein
MNESPSKITIDLRSIEWAFPFCLVAKDDCVVWASSAVIRRIPDAVGRTMSSTVSAGEDAGKFRLLTGDGELPLEGRCVRTSDGDSVFQAVPEWREIDELSRFFLDDFPDNSPMLDLAVLRDEYRVSLADARKAVLELKESEAKLRSLIDTTSEGVAFIEPNGRISDANRAAEEILGLSRDEIIGSNVISSKWQILTPEGVAVAFEDLPCAKASRTLTPVTNVEMMVVQPLGAFRRINCSASPILKPDGSIDGVVEAFVDITVSRNIEKVLARNEATMRAILENAPFGVMLIDKEYGMISMANAYAAKLLGLPPSEIEGRMYHHFVLAAELGKCPIAELEQTVDNSERILLTADKRKIPVLKTVVPVVLQDQSFLLDCFIDITDRKLLETQLNQAQKLESVGRLAAGIAHELNTPAQYVGDNLHFLKDSFLQISKILSEYIELKTALKEGRRTEAPLDAVENAEADADLEFLLADIPSAIVQSIEGIERVSSIVRAMKEFAHPGSDQKTPVNINHALETTITVSRSEWKCAADIETDFDLLMPEVPCYPGEINQVFLNLIVNAAHAVRDAADTRRELGKIIFRTRVNGPFVEIRVEDNGTGIPKGIRDKIMEPFFTTKEVGKGSGQGLTIARSCVVDKHHGTLTFETEEGKGTTFIVSLPIKEVGGMSQSQGGTDE